jgi:pyridoxal phosphate enzyme (YggS family)
MSVNTNAYHQIKNELSTSGVELVAVSKTKPNQDIIDLYEIGQRDFGENYVQELVDKAASLPQDIQWHFIGHLQSNKVKYIAPFVYLIHGVDSEKLLQEINKQAIKHNRVIHILLQVHIASEETKFGFDANSLMEFIQSGRWSQYQNIVIKGLMGMASFTEDMNQVINEFSSLSHLFQQVKNILPTTTFKTLSMGMSSDYAIAIQEGSNMVRIGSLLFGARDYAK